MIDTSQVIHRISRTLFGITISKQNQNALHHNPKEKNLNLFEHKITN